MKNIVLLNSLFCCVIIQCMADKNVRLESLDDVPAWTVAQLNKLTRKKSLPYSEAPKKRCYKMLFLTPDKAKVIEFMQKNSSQNWIGPAIESFGEGENIVLTRKTWDFKKWHFKEKNLGTGILLWDTYEVKSFDFAAKNFNNLITNIRQNWEMIEEPLLLTNLPDYIMLSHQTKFDDEEEFIYHLAMVFGFGDKVQIDRQRGKFKQVRSHIFVHKSEKERFATTFNFDCFTKPICCTADW